MRRELQPVVVHDDDDDDDDNDQRFLYDVHLCITELDPTRLFTNAKHTIAISVTGKAAQNTGHAYIIIMHSNNTTHPLTGIVFPFILGSAGSILLYQHRTEDPDHPVPFPSFLLFTG